MMLKWGEAGSGRISHDFVTSVQTFLSSNHRYVAVADEWSKENANKFAADHDIPRSYGSYLELAQDEEVDVVHVGTITPFHFKITKLMLEHGKHVLCEKPLTLTQQETRELYKIAKQNKVFLMEGLWTCCFPAIIEMKTMLDDGVIGDVMFVSAQIGQALQHVERITSPTLGGGAIFDLGLYAILFQQLIFKNEKPSKIVINGHLNPSGTDECCGAVITYPGGKMAVISTSTKVDLPSDATVVGTKGSIKIPDFWCPVKLITPNGVKEFPLPKSSLTFLHHNSPGLSYEAEEVRQCILAGKTESSKVTAADSINLASLTERFRKEVGVKYTNSSQ